MKCKASHLIEIQQNVSAFMLQIAPTEEETKKLKGYLEQPGRTLADLSTPEQFMHVIGQVDCCSRFTICVIVLDTGFTIA